MTGTNIFAAVIMTLGTSATLTVAHVYGWEGFGTYAFAGSGQCKAPVITVGWSRESRTRAETNALLDWAKRANRYGHSYSKWHTANNRQVDCKRVSGNSIKCTAKARPCLALFDESLPALY